MAQETNLSRQLYDRYNNYKESDLNKKWLKHKDIVPLINRLTRKKLFKVTRAGKSIEDRDIFLISAGKGPIPVLLWSQMHGDESTATMALFDIFNFFSVSDEFDAERKFLLDNLTLYFVPMLNPDGAERFQRRNAISIDLNRDANRLQAPESRLLKELRDKLKPAFGFNLHDQSPRYSAGNSYRTAALSFLAPPFDYQKSINTIRESSMKLISHITHELGLFIPGHIAKYGDDFEPRAFGDNIQRWGTSTILIESGGWKNDTQKQFIRKLNFTGILTGLHSIASGSYKEINIASYYMIPNNDNMIYDLILRKVQVKSANIEYITDIAINRQEINQAKGDSVFYRSSIEDIGDLSVFYGLEELDCSQMTLEYGKALLDADYELDRLSEGDILKKLSQGYLFIQNKNTPKGNFTSLPINFLRSADRKLPAELKLSTPANFFLKYEGKYRYAIINGFIFDLKTNTNKVINSLVF